MKGEEQRRATGDQGLAVFVSSSMAELEAERKAVLSAIENAGGFKAFAFERDEVARAKSSQEVWAQQLEQTDVTIVLLWKKLGQWTKDEIEISNQLAIPILLFRKKDEDNTLDTTDGDYIRALEDVESGITAKYFKSLKKLQGNVEESLWTFIKDLSRAARKTKLDEQTQVRGVGRSAVASDGGLRVVEAAGPSIERREPHDLRRLPRNRWPFVGRVAEKTKLMKAIDSRAPLVALVGPPGVGRRSLLQDLTHHGDFGPAFPDGAAIHPDWVDQHSVEDLLQAIWEEFYDSDDTSIVEPRRRNRQLRDKRALVFLPDIDSSTDLIGQICDQMPETVLCITVQEPRAGAQLIPIGSLTEPEEMLAVFEGPYQASVPDEVRDDVAALCTMLNGNPSLIDVLANRAWGEAEYVPDDPRPHPLIPWVAALRDVTPEALAGWLVPSAAHEVAAVLRAIGVDTPRPVLASVVDSTEEIDDALVGNLVRAASPRYRLNPALETVVDPDESVLHQVFENTLVWIADAGTAEIYANRAFVLRMMTWGAEQERWAEVIELGRAAEKAMALGGRHGAWEEVLQGIAGAAQRIQPVDGGVLAWAHHQLGSRALLRDELRNARVLLHEALELRSEHADDAQAVTRHNLKLVPAAINSVGLLALMIFILAIWFSALRPPSTLGSPPNDPGPRTAISDIDPDVGSFVSAGDERTFTVRNVGTTPFDFRAINGVPGNFELVRSTDECSDTTLDPDSEGVCTFTLKFLGGDTVYGFVSLSLEVEEGVEIEGDREILLLVEPVEP